MSKALEELPEPKEIWKGVVGQGAFEKPRYRPVKLDAIKIDGGTQQRATVAAIVDEYAQEMADGAEFPAIRTVFDGSVHWLVDGFHRYHAARKAGLVELVAYVHNGDQRDAVFMSYAANKDHGLRRQNGVVRKIVEAMFADPKWGKVSAAGIGSHVGVSQRYVERIKSELRAGKKGDRPNNSDDEPATRRVKRGDAEYDMNVGGMSKSARGRAAERATDRAAEGAGDNDDGAAEDDVPEPTDALGRVVKLKEITVDALGATLTRPEHIDVFTRAVVTKAHMHALSKIKTATLEAMGERAENPDKPSADPLYAFIPQGYARDMDNARASLAQSLPHALCPMHADDVVARDGCKWCQSLGWLTKGQYAKAMDAKNAPPPDPNADKKLSELVASTEDKPSK